VTNAPPSARERVKRVLYVNRVPFIGGTERIVLTLADSIECFGYVPMLICPDGGDLADAARARGMSVEGSAFNRMRITGNPITLAGYPLAWWRGRRHLERYAAAHGVSLIHVHHPVSALYSIRAARQLRLPLILHMHDGLVMKPLYRMALRHAARHADRIICVSDTARDLILEVNDQSAKVCVIGNGLAPSFFTAEPAPTDEVVGPGPHIGIFGVIEPQKGHHVLLEAAVAVARQHPLARFWIVGPKTYKDKSSYVAFVTGLAAAPELAGRVTFTGFRNDVSRWMQAMDIVAMPSVGRESFGLSAAEAMALGRPVVVSADGGGLSRLVRDGITGRLVPPGDAEALASVINSMLEKGSASMGECAAADIRARFGSDTFAGSVASVYDDVLSRWPG
jgi:glycosyltransferase involved in cell wall biosynthesis